MDAFIQAGVVQVPKETERARGGEKGDGGGRGEREVDI